MTTWLTTIFNAMSQPFKWWVVVAPWEQGIRVRLGKEAFKLDSGIHLRIPFLDRVYVQSVRLRIITSGTRTISTSDGKIISLNLGIRFAVRDIKQLYSTIADPEKTLLNHASSLVAEYVFKTDSKNLSPKDLQDYVDINMVDDNWGLCNVSVHVIDFALTKTYRLIMNDYEGRSGFDLEHDNYGSR
ncbi:hypothetical protein LCGC14_1680890 [marine sediment metagenome]|uniref:Band 7 domain-containing protein n=1 Tax=marine sediment metagenome TaxID=412755 RepID=A0A0F9KNM5_9ZZZZ